MARILRPLFGVAMLVLFLGMEARFWHHNLINTDDRRWLRSWRDVVSNREERVPEVGREQLFARRAKRLRQLADRQPMQPHRLLLGELVQAFCRE